MRGKVPGKVESRIDNHVRSPPGGGKYPESGLLPQRIFIDAVVVMMVTMSMMIVISTLVIVFGRWQPRRLIADRVTHVRKGACLGEALDRPCQHQR